MIDLFGIGALLIWLLPEDLYEAGCDILDPPENHDTPLLKRFLGLHSPLTVFKRPARLKWWTWSRKPLPEQWQRASTADVMRAVGWLPLSDRFSKAIMGWTTQRSALAWTLGFPILSAGLAACIAVQLTVAAVSGVTFMVVALFLGVGTFGFYSDKKVALRCACEAAFHHELCCTCSVCFDVYNRNIFAIALFLLTEFCCICASCHDLVASWAKCSALC